MRTARQGAMKATLLLLVLALVSYSMFVYADPSGASISNAVTETAVNVTAGSRSDERGTITTMLLNTVQQDQQWKAYVGNVTGVLTLDDAANYTIYDWDLTTITGEVYASRYNNLTWSSVSCAPASLIVTELNIP